jgi:N-acetylmuramoyl-L-alanine amidase
MRASSDNPDVVDRLVDWYTALPRRAVEDITTVVLHATEIPDLEEAWEVAMKSAGGDDGAGVCGHLYVDRDGTTYRFVPLDRVASHVRGWNTPSIGIELVNTGRHPRHFDSRSQEPSEPFPESQIRSLKRLLAHLKATCPNLVQIVRHSDLDRGMVVSTNDRSTKVHRRIDPGPLFPWEEIRSFWDEMSGTGDRPGPSDDL